jgi:hypothetical protein
MIILYVLIGILLIYTILSLYIELTTINSDFFHDDVGRIQIYHGVNICNYSKWSKDRLPWHTIKEYKLLKESGFNLVRFLIYWDAIEPCRYKTKDYNYLE